MSQNEIAAAARAICEEKGISLEAVIEAIESALAAAYRKDFGKKNQNIKVKFDLDTGKSKVCDEKTVVEDLPEEEEDGGDDEASGESDKEDMDDKDEKNKKTKKQKNKDEDNEEKDGSKKVVEDSTENEGEEERKFNPRTEIQQKDAVAFAELGKRKPKKEYKIGDVIRVELEVPSEYGRMAAQTAKQVIIQRLREVERSNLYDEFKEKEHEVVTGIVQRREGRIVLIDLGRTVGILTADGQVPGERYEPGQRIKVYVERVNATAKGPEIILSRTSVEIVHKIFLLEIPEISNGLVEIKSVAREAGSRSKIAVSATEENVDPIGSCVGQRGARIQTIISELGGEKVDIIEYDEDPARFIANALAPAKVLGVEVDEDENKKTATATVASDQLSLAIGKGGQNVRLAARLTGWRIDVKEVRSTKSEVGSTKDEDVKDEQENKKTKKQENTEIQKQEKSRKDKDKESEKEDEKEHVETRLIASKDEKKE